jgi:hypothetical protein
MRGEISRVIALSARPRRPAEEINLGLYYRNLENLFGLMRTSLRCTTHISSVEPRLPLT